MEDNTAPEKPQKNWQTDYAKSGRSVCKTCSTAIDKGTLRLAIVVESFVFDGSYANWHHADCILSKPGGFKSLDELSGVEKLKTEDIDKLTKYIEAGGQDPDNEDYTVENSKNARATCKSCKEKIMKGEVRVAEMVLMDPGSGPFKRKVHSWRHATCFMKLGWWVQPLEELPGWNSLSIDDQKSLSKLVKPASENRKSGKSSKRKATAGAEEIASPGAAPDSKLPGDKMAKPVKEPAAKRQKKGLDDASPAGITNKRKPQKKEDAGPPSLSEKKTKKKAN